MPYFIQTKRPDLKKQQHQGNQSSRRISAARTDNDQLQAETGSGVRHSNDRQDHSSNKENENTTQQDGRTNTEKDGGHATTHKSGRVNGQDGHERVEGAEKNQNQFGDEEDDSPLAHSARVINFTNADPNFTKGVKLATDNTTQFITLKTVLKNEIFPHLKVLHTDAEVDDIAPGSFGGILMKKLHVAPALQMGYWSATKTKANRFLGNLRQQVNTKLKTSYFSKSETFSFLTLLQYFFLTLFIAIFKIEEHQHSTGAPSLNHLTKYLRCDPAAYTWFVNIYLVCSVGRGQKNKLLTMPLSKVFTIGDEAIVLWYMENSWHIWKDMKETNNTKSSACVPMYTVSGDKGGGGKGAGWNELGKKRYNELFDLVENSRRSTTVPSFDSYYQSLLDPKKFAKTRKTSKPPVVQPTTTRNTLALLCTDANVDLEEHGTLETPVFGNGIALSQHRRVTGNASTGLKSGGRTMTSSKSPAFSPLSPRGPPGQQAPV